jgi:hypothetical protein
VKREEKVVVPQIASIILTGDQLSSPKREEKKGSCTHKTPLLGGYDKLSDSLLSLSL